MLPVLPSYPSPAGIVQGIRILFSLARERMTKAGISGSFL